MFRDMFRTEEVWLFAFCSQYDVPFRIFCTRHMVSFTALFGVLPINLCTFWRAQSAVDIKMTFSLTLLIYWSFIYPTVIDVSRNCRTVDLHYAFCTIT